MEGIQDKDCNLLGNCEKHEAMEGFQDKDCNLLGNDKFPNLNKRLLHERKLKSGYLERRIYERPLKSEPFIESQSEHMSKLSLHQSLVKREFIAKRHRRAREPSRIPLRFLRRLNRRRFKEHNSL